ncbi:dihydrolipoamide acetyltransferase family protein [Arthrobacter castelli]|uniref:dihydrolipoamide acetyltransferase family protein n=1 Tax=Arthrobacter castelli TaxID=271431 RepID=UPI0003F7CC36|nr:dihydrolipoamide acetyltransferase family protein [Arthrobacter castelli]
MPDVVMPRLSDTMAEGVLSRWIMNEGDAVKKGDVLAEVETDKATMDLEAFDSGVLERQLVSEGTSVAIGDPVGFIGSGEDSGSGGGSGSGSDEETGSGEDSGSGGQSSSTDAESSADGTEPAPEAEATGAAESQDDQSQAADREETTTESRPQAQPAKSTASGSSSRLLTSPLARRTASEHGLDLSTVKGTGPGGRIVRADVEAAVEAQEQAPERAAATGAAGTESGTGTGSEEVPLSQMRRVTARRLSESAAAPHYFLTNVVYVDRLLAFRSEVNASFAESGTKVSVTDLLVRACAVTLRNHPQVNSSWGEDKILRHQDINVGLAVAVEEGLMVPVVKGADAKGLDTISAETRDMAERARAGRLKPDEFSGGTFTISNLGMFGIDNFTAVINPPESAILAVGAASDEPYVQDGQLQTRKTMKITMTSDHRVLDGAVSAAFLQDLKRTLEEPLRMLL